jgi:hypothetical protein
MIVITSAVDWDVLYLLFHRVSTIILACIVPLHLRLLMPGGGVHITLITAIDGPVPVIIRLNSGQKRKGRICEKY